MVHQTTRNTIYYICSYDHYDNERNLSSQPSCITKVNYVKESLKKCNYFVSVFSIAECNIDRLKLNKKQVVNIDPLEKIIYPITIGRTNLFLKILSRLLVLSQLIYFILFTVKKDDKVLVYHSLAIYKIIKWIQLICKKRIFIEVEEIYHAVKGCNSKEIHAEINYLKGAHGYIFVNDIIQQKCDIIGDSVVCYGTYNYKALHKRHITTDLIHVVYAGVIGQEGSDAFVAADTAKYLTNKYYIHILGYGRNSDIQKLKAHIESINRVKDRGVVSYDGCLSGSDYSNFLAKCTIGLCTRVLNDELSDYTFPSKVMVYLANDLLPICSPLRCIQKSRVNTNVLFCKSLTPKFIAQAIVAADLSIINTNKSLLIQLDNAFTVNMKELFK